jgi:hypothetical protein
VKCENDSKYFEDSYHQSNNHLNINSVHKYIALICFNNNVEILGTDFPISAYSHRENLPNQTGKIFIATRVNSSLSLELARILYCKGARVCMASRSQSNSYGEIKTIQSTLTATLGQIKYLHLLGLDDLSTIKSPAAEFSA